MILPPFKLRDESCEHVLADREILGLRIAAGSVAAVGLKIFKNVPLRRHRRSPRHPTNVKYSIAVFPQAEH